jgi:hypothetical protein
MLFTHVNHKAKAMKNVISVFVGLLFLGFTQLNAQSRPSEVGVHFGLYMTDYTDMQFLVDYHQVFDKIGTNNYSLGLSPENSIQVGFSYQEYVAEKIGWRIAANFASYHTLFDYGLAPYGIDTSQDEIILTNSVNHHKYFFANVRLTPVLYLTKGKIRPYMAPFIETNFYLGNYYTEKLTFSDDSTVGPVSHKVTDNHRSVNLSAGLELGIQGSITPRLDVAVRLDKGYMLLPAIRNNIYEGEQVPKFDTVGAGISVLYKLTPR